MPTDNRPFAANVAREVFERDTLQLEVVHQEAQERVRQEIFDVLDNRTFFDNMTEEQVGAAGRRAIALADNLTVELAARDPYGILLGRTQYEQIMTIMPEPLYYVSTSQLCRETAERWQHNTGHFHLSELMYRASDDPKCIDRFMADNWWRFYTQRDAAQAIVDQINANRALATNADGDAFVERVPHEAVFDNLEGSGRLPPFTTTWASNTVVDPHSILFYVDIEDENRAQDCAQRVQFVRNFHRVWQELNASTL